MPVNPRNRVLNFRLTEQEYTEVKRAAEEQGSRCVSEFARTALLKQSRPTGSEASVENMFRDLERRICGLDTQLYRLFTVVAGDTVSEAVSRAEVIETEPCL